MVCALLHYFTVHKISSIYDANLCLLSTQNATEKCILKKINNKFMNCFCRAAISRKSAILWYMSKTPTEMYKAHMHVNVALKSEAN
jgi:hypothetical protein